jgi:hypothetical protein
MKSYLSLLQVSMAILQRSQVIAVVQWVVVHRVGCLHGTAVRHSWQGTTRAAVDLPAAP